MNEMISQEPFGQENHNNKKELIVLVGPPAIGKSTYIAKRKFSPDDVIVINRDNIVDEVAVSIGKTYDDMFNYTDPEIKNANDTINKKLEHQFKTAVISGKNIIVDMTNMNSKTRKRALQYADGHDFFKIAVVFTMQESDMPELLNRMQKRSLEIGSKTIGQPIIDRMISSFQQVSPDEGFDKVETFNNFK